MNKAFTRETDDAPPAPPEERAVSPALNLVSPRGAQLIKEQISVWRASSAIAPAISTPVGPPPTTTKVKLEGFAS